MKRVFIVDDHAAVLRVLRLGLEEAGYDVESSGDGAECLVKLHESLPDFLITDIDMPRMSGRELCEAIVQQFPNRTFPIVVLTSLTELEHRNWTRDISNLEFMEKPVSIRRLVSMIAKSWGTNAEMASV